MGMPLRSITRMTEATVVPIVVAIIISLPPTLVALAGLLQGRRNGASADRLMTKTAEIHTLADGNLTRVSTALDVANEKIVGLEKLMAQLIQARDATGEPVKVEVVNTPLETTTAAQASASRKGVDGT